MSKEKAYTALIMGFGHAGRAYCEALKSVQIDWTIDVFDPSPSAQMPAHVRRVELDAAITYDLCIIASPPEFHLENVEYAVDISRVVILEKPIAISLKDYQKIKEISREKKNVYFSFHAMFGLEVERNLRPEAVHDQVLKVSHAFFDPYGAKSKVHLGGAFWDSIYNVMSVFLKVINAPLKLSSIKIIEDTNSRFCCRVIYFLGGSNTNIIEQNILINWDLSLNYKVTQISNSRSDKTISHSMQSTSNIDGTNILPIPLTMPRLISHYRRVIEEAMDASRFDENRSFEAEVSSLVWALQNERLRVGV